MQEGNSSSNVGQQPKGFPVLLLHDLADCCRVGEVVEVTGVVLLQLQGALASGATFQCSHQ